jgi:branched-chain amino acid transport system substrate-binding protein
MRMKQLIIAAIASCALHSIDIGAAPALPVHIGMVSEMTGPDSELGTYQSNGMQLALEEINQAGGVLGRPLQIDIEDNQSTNPGSVLAVSKLLEKKPPAAIITSITC